MPSSRHRLSDAPELCRLLDRPSVVTLSTVSPAGKPQASVVWVERREDRMVMLFERRSAKYRNISGNPNVSLLVVDHDNPLRVGVPAYAQMSGVAEVLTEEEDFIDRLARRYGWVDGWDQPRGDSVLISVTVDRIAGYGPGPGVTMGGWGGA